jgi:LacI family transcriptional regulator
MSARRKSRAKARPAARVTLREIAQQADVSTATVSLVLRESPLVADTTRQRVQEAIAKLGYVYNRGAANLRTRRTNTVGIVINDLTNPYFAELTAAMESTLGRVGRIAFLSNSEESPERQDRFIDKLREYNVDGVLMTPALGTPATSLRRLKQWGLPCVQVSRYVQGAAADYAGSDNLQGAEMVTRHLIALGHRRIAFIGGSALSSTGRDRRDGFRKAMRASGLTIDDQLIVECPPTRESSAAAILTLLDRVSAPTAAVGFNDITAFGIMLGLMRRGIRPGQDFAVTGFDDVSEAALWMPPLTTVGVDRHAIGEVAATLLLERIAHPDAPARRKIVAPKLIVRESCGAKGRGN